MKFGFTLDIFVYSAIIPLDNFILIGIILKDHVLSDINQVMILQFSTASLQYAPQFLQKALKGLQFSFTIRKCLYSFRFFSKAFTFWPIGTTQFLSNASFAYFCSQPASLT